MELQNISRTKRYVDVIVRWFCDGHFEPSVIIWDKNHKWKIEEIIGAPISDSFPGSPVRHMSYTV
ncbi:MAG: hypothetical protein LUB61_07980, partial [Eggerthellaceae bacterium]|nr:hypothetical protein [Eggerthellaceae bacterium]